MSFVARSGRDCEVGPERLWFFIAGNIELISFPDFGSFRHLVATANGRVDGWPSIFWGPISGSPFVFCVLRLAVCVRQPHRRDLRISIAK
jgi:hypothetical protein